MKKKLVLGAAVLLMCGAANAQVLGLKVYLINAGLQAIKSAVQKDPQAKPATSAQDAGAVKPAAAASAAEAPAKVEGGNETVTPVRDEDAERAKALANGMAALEKLGPLTQEGAELSAEQKAGMAAVMQKAAQDSAKAGPGVPDVLAPLKPDLAAAALGKAAADMAVVSIAGRGVTQMVIGQAFRNTGWMLDAVGKKVRELSGSAVAAAATVTTGNADATPAAIAESETGR